jgi:hypothetical protein
LAGSLNVYQWVELTAAHEIRHADQIREIGAALRHCSSRWPFVVLRRISLLPNLQHGQTSKTNSLVYAEARGLQLPDGDADRRALEVTTARAPGSACP